MKRGLLTLALLATLNGGAQAQALVALVEQGQFAAVADALRSGADVSQRSPDGTTALHWAVYHGEVELVRDLLDAKADPNVRNDYGSSPMGEAAAVGNTVLLRLLLEAGADVEAANAEGQTALMAVARTGNIEAARLLIDRGADVNATESWGGQTALMWAAARQQPEMVSFLIAQGAEVDQRAIDRNWERRVTAEPRVKEMHTGGFTALLYAAREDCLDCAKALLAGGADINKPDPDNISPLLMALLNQRFDIAKYLVEQGADVDQWDYWGRTPLYMAVDTNQATGSYRGELPPIQHSTGLEVARLLIDRGAQVDYALKLAPLPREIAFDRANDNGVMNTGSTPLQRAAYGGDLAMMKLLLDSGANRQLANVNGVTPLIALTSTEGTRSHLKDEATVIEGLKLLMDAGGDINQHGGTRNETPLHTAVRRNWQEVVRFLVDNGADLQAEDQRGLKPLDWALGRADSQTLGNFDVVGELPEMAALLRDLMQEEQAQ